MNYNLLFYTKIIFSFCLMAYNYSFTAQTISVTGNDWVVPIPSITEAGNNYEGTYESVSNQIVLTVSVPLLLGSSKVSMHYEANPTWHNSLILSGKRTNNGTTLCLMCRISGGTSYQTITQNDIELFRIQAVLEVGAYRGINIQLQLSGISVAIPATSYGSRIVFTVSPT